MQPEKTLDDLIAGMREKNREADQVTGLLADSFVQKLLLQGYMQALTLADIKCQESMRKLADQLNGNRVSFSERAAGHLEPHTPEENWTAPRVLNRSVA